MHSGKLASTNRKGPAVAKKESQTYIEGTEPPKIDEIEDVFAKYEETKEKRMKLLEKEKDQKAEVIEVLERHADDLPTDEDGYPFYKSYALEKTITLQIDEKIKVKRMSSEE